MTSSDESADTERSSQSLERLRSSLVGIVSLRSESDGRHLDLTLTPETVAGGVAASVALLVVLTGLGSVGLGVPILRPVLGFVLLSVVPGALFLSVLGLRPSTLGKFAVYSVGASMTVVMATGLAANFTLPLVGVAHPITEWPMVLVVSALLLALSWLHVRRVDETVTLDVPVDRLLAPRWLALALLPFLAVYGAITLTALDSNLLLILLYAGIVVVALLAMTEYLPARGHPFALWVVSVSLLLQNTLTGNYLAWGDEPKEAQIADLVLNLGVWNPSLHVTHANKYAMLRIALLHPIYSLVANLSVLWEFRLVHPLLFSIAPVALYYLYRRYVSGRTAFLSSFLFVSLFSFFVVLSRNTRTGAAIMFIALFALAFADDLVPRSRAKLLGILFALSIVVSHYGVSYMVMMMLPAVVVATLAMNLLFRDWDPLTTTPAFIAVYLIGSFTWFIYASAGSASFRTLVGFFRNFQEKLQEQLGTHSQVVSSHTSASTHIVTNNWHSATLQHLKQYNLLIGGIIGIGLAMTLLRHLVRRERDDFDNEFLAFASVALAMFVVTFLPVAKFNTARTYPTTMVFFAPFFVMGVREPVLFARWLVGDRVPRLTTQRIAVAMLVLYFSLNVGLVSATVTHQYSTNVLVEKPRVMTNGHPAGATYFYKQYPTVYSASATEWFRTRVAANATVYLSQWPGGTRYPFGYRKRYPGRQFVPVHSMSYDLNGTIGPGYAFVGPLGHLTGTIGLPTTHFGFLHVPTDHFSGAFANRSRVYDNGGSVVYGNTDWSVNARSGGNTTVVAS